MAQEIEPIAAANRNFAAVGGYRPLLLMNPQSYAKESRWIPYQKGRGTLEDNFKIRYWNGKKWTVKSHKAHRYRSKEYAESVAFKLTLKEKSLIGELEVEQWVPCSRPKSRLPRAGTAPA